VGYVEGVGEVGGARIEGERQARGLYRSLFDFLQRTGLGEQATLNLIRVGAFDAFGLNRRELIWQLGLLGGNLHQANLRRPPAARQLRLPLPTVQDEVPLEDFSAYQRMVADYELLSLSPDSHPMQFLRPALGEGVISSRHLRQLNGGEMVEIAGLVVCRQRPVTAKGIIFLLLEDEYGMVNVLVSRQMSERYRDEVRTAAFLRVSGQLEEWAGEQRTLIALEIAEVLPSAAVRMPSGKTWA
jgi:error-prone DNA polymerase